MKTTSLISLACMAAALLMLPLCIPPADSANHPITLLGGNTNDTFLSGFWTNAATTNADRIIGGLNTNGTLRLTDSLMATNSALLTSINTFTGDSNIFTGAVEIGSLKTRLADLTLPVFYYDSATNITLTNATSGYAILTGGDTISEILVVLPSAFPDGGTLWVCNFNVDCLGTLALANASGVIFSSADPEFGVTSLSVAIGQSIKLLRHSTNWYCLVE